MLSLGYNIYDINIFYKYTDIVTNFCEDEEYLDDIVDKLTKNGNYNNYFVDGFELLPIYKLNNILHENNKDILFEGKSIYFIAKKYGVKWETAKRFVNVFMNMEKPKPLSSRPKKHGHPSILELEYFTRNS